jgi:hypothetical protein
MNSENDYRILHAFADCGVEDAELSRYGTVTRASIEPRDNPYTDEVQTVDLLKDAPDGHFDLGLFHPVCSKWAGPTDITGDRDEHVNMIPRARELAREHCAEWIVENVPAAPLEDPVVLDGKMFALPVRYARAFETSVSVPQPPRQQSLGTETSTHYYSEKSREWWAAQKGYPPDIAPKEHLAKNCVPAPYLRWLLTAWLESTGAADGAGRDYEGYHEEVETRKRAAENAELEAFST